MIAAAAGIVAVALALARLAPGTALASRVLLAATAQASSTRAAASGLDISIVTRTAEDSYWRGRRLTSRPWPPLTGAAALAWGDWRRLARRPAWLAVLFATAVLPALAGLAAGELEWSS